VLAEFLSDHDVRRVREVMAKLDACGFRGALTGGLAVEMQLRLHGQPTSKRPLNDLDFVVESLDSIPASVTDCFLVHHVHPRAERGKLLLQLVEPEHAVRIDLFGQFGGTLARTLVLGGRAGPIELLAVEDLFARTVSSLLSALRKGQAYEAKQAQFFRRLDGLGEAAALKLAWRDHRQDAKESLAEAVAAVRHLLRKSAAPLISRPYSATVTLCAKCEDSERFVRAAPERILDVLGYW
jgi:hypothetical protein